MGEVFIIMATPHFGYGEPYVWKVFNSLEKAESEMDRIAKKYRMEWIKDELINKASPSLKYRFESFEICRFFVD